MDSEVDATRGRHGLEDQLARRMAALGVQEADFEESFVRSGGPGGQNVNKTATCVMLLHRPSGLRVKCQDSRAQGKNRLLARQRLLDRLETVRRQEVEAARALREKQRRQTRRPSARAKQRMLEEKSRRRIKKAQRRQVHLD